MMKVSATAFRFPVPRACDSLPGAFLVARAGLALLQTTLVAVAGLTAA